MKPPSSNSRPVGVLIAAVLSALLLWPAPARAQYDGDPDEEIIYIDSFGFIRIVDPGQSNQNTAVQWRSPEGDWEKLALGDVNNDGDAEIVAIRENGNGGLLTVFDPVVNDSTIPIDGRINGVPWSRLFDLDLPGEPATVTTGNFSGMSPADEFAVGVNLFSAEDDEIFIRQDVSIYRAIDRSGVSWFPTVEARSFRNEWTALYSGNLDNVGLDELILLDDNLSALEVYRVENGLDDADRIFNSESETKSWSDVTTGRFSTTRIQMAAVREAPLGLSNFFVSEYDNESGNWSDLVEEQFLPSPWVIFDGDINNDGTDELFMLRRVPTSAGNRPRLFMRNLGGNTQPTTFEDILDADNGYQAGAAGDTDGDDKDEVVILRDNRIRIYTEPEISASSKVDYIRTTDRRTIGVANVDTNGYLPPPAFVVTPESLTIQLPRGRNSGPEEVTVANIATHGNFPFTVEIPREIDWIDVVPLREQRTPATFSVYVDARALRVGSYVGEITLVAPATAGVTNNDYVVAVNLTVTDGLSVLPATVIDRRQTCTAGQESNVTTVSVAGATGTEITAQIVDNDGAPVPWATVAPAAGTTPLTLAITTTPAQSGPHLAAARLQVQTSQDSTPLTASAQVALQCAAEVLMLPHINRN